MAYLIKQVLDRTDGRLCIKLLSSTLSSIDALKFDWYPV